MENMGKFNAEDAKMQGLIDGYLKARPSGFTSAEGSHLDEDSLAAFVEGNLNEREARPVMSHLIDCSFCRHITSELVRLDLAFAEDDVISPIAENSNQPAKVSTVLSGLLSRIFGTSDGAVFAHHEDEERKAADEDKETKE